MKLFLILLFSVTTITSYSQSSSGAKKDQKKTDPAAQKKQVPRVVKSADTLFVDAGNDQSLPANTKSATLCGKVKVPTGEIRTYSWKHLSGPGSPKFSDDDRISTQLLKIEPGIHRIELTVTDANGHVARDIMNLVIPPAPPIDTVFVYISAGQSNSRGSAARAAIDSMPFLDAQYRLPGVEIFNWPDRTMRGYRLTQYNGTQSVGTPYWWGGDMVCSKVFDSLRGGFGAGADSVVHFKTNLGGSSLAPYAGAVGCWTVNQDSLPAGKIRILDSFTVRWAAFKAAWNGRGYYVKPIVLMWHQGESDNFDSSGIGSNKIYGKNGYAARQSALFYHLRNNVLGEPNLKILIGGVPNNSAEYSATIEGAKQAFVDGDGGNSYYINLNGVPLLSDNGHFCHITQTYYGNEMYRIIKTFAR